MEGLGSQLCNHLVERVIDHIEQSINPRLDEYHRITMELIRRTRFSMCRMCKTPFENDLNTVVRCKKFHYNSLCDSLVTCGRLWCKPLKCLYCGDELCSLRLGDCDIDGCKNNSCHNCISECNLCAFFTCQEHAKTYLKSVTFSVSVDVIRGCV